MIGQINKTLESLDKRDAALDEVSIAIENTMKALDALKSGLSTKGIVQ